MNVLADAEASVHRARRRLLARAAADGAARGTLAGATGGAVLWLASWWASVDAGMWPLAVLGAGLVVGAAAAVRRGIAIDVAALTLDAAAGTDEAFISAMTATSAAPEFRALSADYAVARCPPAAVSRALPFRAPVLASAAAVAAALVAALVLIPRSGSSDRAQEPDRRGDAGETLEAVAPGRSAADASPSERVSRLRDAVKGGPATGESEPLAASVRKDLGAVSDSELRALADALAAKSVSADAAKRAIAALDRGDRASAVAALREALGGAPTAPSLDGTGTQTATDPASSRSGALAPWSAATWPLRYDRAVRRYLDDVAASEASPK